MPTSPPYDILHTLWSAQPGFRSFARIVGGLASGLDPKRYRIHALFLREGGPVVEELEEAGAHVRAIGWRGNRDIAGTWRIWKALRSRRWTIIHLHAQTTIIRFLAHATTDAKVLLHLHARETDEVVPRPVFRQVGDVDAVIATSQAVAEMAVGKVPHVVYPGIQVLHGSALPTNKTGRVIGTTRRLVRSKGIDHLIRSIALLRPEFPDIRLEIAGLGPEQAHLEQEAEALGLANNVRFLGWQMDVEPLLSRWDIFAMPSLEEGFGIAALEAMAAGLPVVATAVGGVPELVEHGRTGLLVPPADEPALAEAFRALLRNPEQRRLMAIAGLNRAAEQFSMDRMVSQVEKIYDDLLGFS